MTKLIGAACASMMMTLAFTYDVNAAVYCYPQGMVTTCFTDDGRTFTNNDTHVRNPNITIVPQYYPYIPEWEYHGQPRRYVPEQDFGECTLALGCIKGRR